MRIRVAIAVALVAALLTWAGPAALAADPSRVSSVPTATQVTASAEQTRTVDLFRSSAAVLQYTSYWCVPAAAQTMINLATGRSDRSYATQSRLYTELRRANLYHYSTRGNDVRGWARVLTARLPAGMGYADASFSSRSAAYLAIVKAMDRTRRPVGIVVDEGSPCLDGRRVQRPRDAGRGELHDGPRLLRRRAARVAVGPVAEAVLTVSQLSSRFTRYHESQRSVPWEGLYVIVSPLATTGAVTPTR